MQQVRFTAGLISALGCAGAVVSGPAWIAVPAFIGCGEFPRENVRAH